MLPGSTRVVPEVLVLGVALLVSLPVSAADHYVNDASTTGDVALPGCPAMPAGANVNGCGTCALPCATPSYLYGRVALTGGDTVHLNTGSYLGIGTSPILDLDNPAKAGSPGNWLTFTGPVDEGGRPLRDAGGAPLAVLDGRGMSPAGVVIRTPGIRLQALALTTFSAALEPYCGSGVRLVEGFPVTSFELVGLDVTGVVSTCGNAVDIDQPRVTCAHCVIRDNHFHDNPAGNDAIWLRGLSGVDVAGNAIRGWGADSGSAALRVIGSSGTRFRNNVVADGSGPGVVAMPCEVGVCAGAQTDGLEISHNTFRHNARSSAAAEQLSGPVEIYLLGGSGYRIVNNILNPEGSTRHAFRFQGAVVDMSDFNGFYLENGARLSQGTPSTASLAAWQATGRDPSSLAADPRFVSAADLHLGSTAGRLDAQGTLLAPDAQTSPFLDRADPASEASREPSPNGGRANLGAYGNTPEAALTPVVLALVSGSAQAASVDAPLAAPLVVEVLGAGEGGAAQSGVEVRFAIVAGAGSLSSEQAVTGASGRGEVGLTPGAVGILEVEASLPRVHGATPVRFAFSVVPAGGAPDGGENPDAGEPPDAGADAGVPLDPEPLRLPVSYVVACGCTEASAAGPGALLLLALGLGRRIRRR